MLIQFFSQIVTIYDRFSEYKRLPAPQKSWKDLVVLEELCNITPITGQSLLHKVGWALSNETAHLHCQPLRRSAVLIA